MQRINDNRLTKLSYVAICGVKILLIIEELTYNYI